jgi:hypothetical protein
MRILRLRSIFIKPSCKTWRSCRRAKKQLRDASGKDANLSQLLQQIETLKSDLNQSRTEANALRLQLMSMQPAQGPSLNNCKSPLSTVRAHETIFTRRPAGLDYGVWLTAIIASVLALGLLGFKIAGSNVTCHTVMITVKRPPAA